MKKFLFLDCDSTLCAIEGVDELAALRGPEIEQQVIELTNQAMDGKVPIDEVFGRRLDLIKPSRAMCEIAAEMYIEKLSPNVRESLIELRNFGWEPIIISGGFTQVIEPVAKLLEIEKIFAVDLIFDSAGNYQSFDDQSPTARNGGKPEIIAAFTKDISPLQTVMMGDGISDLETQTVVDLFIGYGGVISREAVKAEASAFLLDFKNLPQVIGNHFSSQEKD